MAGMGSKKLIGENIEYIANYDSHPGAQFNSEFRSLVKGEIAKFAANVRPETVQAVASRPNKPAQLPQSTRVKPAEETVTHQQRGLPPKIISKLLKPKRRSSRSEHRLNMLLRSRRNSRMVR